MSSIRTNLFLLLQVTFYEIVNSQYAGEGQKCALESGRIGTCLRAERCLGGALSSDLGISSNLCGFQQFDSLVCCENSEFAAFRSSGSVAEQKCLEYKYPSIPTTTRSYAYAVGGQDAFPLEFPHMALLGYGSANDTRWSCGGSLISEKFVLTAAHCVQTKYGPVHFVKLGIHQLSDAVKIYLQTMNVSNVHIHPDYSASQGYHDIALLEMERQANIQSGVRPACLQTSMDLPNDTLVATGWGATELYGDNHETLQKVYLKYVPFDSCTTYYRQDRRLRNGVVNDWQLCADGGGLRRDTCQGDSGGPLQIKNYGDDLYTIIGVTSLGIKCAIVPAIYTRVSNYITWIESIVWTI